MNVGRYRVSVHNHGFFRLDGGAMFGSIPKALWAKGAPPDEENRILLATRSLIIEQDDRKMIVDVGCGDKWSEKNRAIFCIGETQAEEERGRMKEEGGKGERGREEGGKRKEERGEGIRGANTPMPQHPNTPLAGITDVLLTHLHFDHAGGVSSWHGFETRGLQGFATPEESSIEPCYPKARHYVMAENYENAKTPHLRERASYLPENVNALEQVELVLTSDGQEIWPGLTVHRSDGHTRGLQWVRLSDGGVTVAFPADLFPTSKHLPVTYAMGYDMCAELSMAEKASFLNQAVDGGWIVVFEHDPVVAAGKLAFDERDRPVVAETLSLK